MNYYLLNVVYGASELESLLNSEFPDLGIDQPAYLELAGIKFPTPPNFMDRVQRHLEIDSGIHRAVGRASCSSGMGFGERDIQYHFTEEEAVQAYQALRNVTELATTPPYDRLQLSAIVEYVVPEEFED